MGNTAMFYSVNQKLSEMSDEDIIELIKSGNVDAQNYLIDKYKEIVNMKVCKYFMIGAEK